MITVVYKAVRGVVQLKMTWPQTYFLLLLINMPYVRKIGTMGKRTDWSRNTRQQKEAHSSILNRFQDRKILNRECTSNCANLTIRTTSKRQAWPHSTYPMDRLRIDKLEDLNLTAKTQNVWVRMCSVKSACPCNYKSCVSRVVSTN